MIVTWPAGAAAGMLFSAGRARATEETSGDNGSNAKPTATRASNSRTTLCHRTGRLMSLPAWPTSAPPAPNVPEITSDTAQRPARLENQSATGRGASRQMRSDLLQFSQKQPIAQTFQHRPRQRHKWLAYVSDDRALSALSIACAHGRPARHLVAGAPPQYMAAPPSLAAFRGGKGSGSWIRVSGWGR